MANFTIWGNVGNQAFALPMAQLTPDAPTLQGYVLAWDVDQQALNYAPLAFDFTSGDATFAGNVALMINKTLSVNALQVLAARRTGWTAATGTPTRTTFDTATVTLPQLAERVKAVLDDLIAHGLIGA